MDRHYNILILIAGSLLYSSLATAQPYSEKRIFRKTVAADREITLEVDNKYGTIQVTPWTTDSLSVRAEVEAFAQDHDRINKMFQGIDISISETSYLVRARTEFTQNISMLFESFKGMTNKIIPYESKIQINYFINAPAYLNMRIINKYGDVYMEDNTGTFSIELSNGSFRAGSLNKTNGLELNFCDATIKKITQGTIKSSFSEFVIDEAQEITINSISSRFNIARAGMITTESRRDKFFIGKAGSVSGKSYFTDFRINELSKELDLETKYGSLNADLIDNTLEQININSGFTDINLVFNPSLSYNLDIRHLNSFLVLPEKNIKIEKKIINEEKKEYMTFGTVGRNPGNIKVTIDANRGNIYLR